METRSTILLIAITAGSCVLATAEQCNDYGLRPDPSNSNPLIWEFYNFTNLGERRGCFLCVEIPADSSRFSQLILPCEPFAISFTLSGFSYNEGDMSSQGAISLSSNVIDCQTAYNSAPVDGFDTRTPKEINLEEERINDYSSSNTYTPTRLYRVGTRTNSITQTVCIRNLAYTYPSTTNSTGITSVTSEKPTTVVTTAISAGINSVSAGAIVSSTTARTTSVTEEMFTSPTAVTSSTRNTEEAKPSTDVGLTSATSSAGNTEMATESTATSSARNTEVATESTGVGRTSATSSTRNTEVATESTGVARTSANLGTNGLSPASITTTRPASPPIDNPGSNSPSSSSTGASDKQHRTTDGDEGLPIWVVAVIVAVAVLICALLGFILAYRKRRTRPEDDRKEHEINKDKDDEEMVYNPVYASGSDTLDSSTSAANDEGRESVVYAGIEESAKTDNDTEGIIYNSCYVGFDAKRGPLESNIHDGHFEDSNDYEGIGEKAKRESRGDPGEQKNVRWSIQKAFNSFIPLYGKVDKNRSKNDDPRKDDVTNCDANDSGTSFRIVDEEGKNEGDYADVSAVRVPGDTSDEGSAAENSKARWSLKKTLIDVVPLYGKVDKNKKKRKEEVHPNNSAASTRQGSSDAPTKSSHSNLYAEVRKEKK